MAASLQALAVEVRSCRLCALRRNCKRPIPGIGKPTARILFVGQAPGWEEDRDGVPWVGQAGQFLSAVLGAVGIPSADIYLTNLVKCYPGKKRGGDAEPPPYAIDACAVHLQAEYELLKPVLVVAVGGVAMKALGVKGGGVNLNSGRIFQTAEWGPVLVVRHPAGIMRRPADAPAFTTQFYAIDTAMAGPLQPPPFTGGS